MAEIESINNHHQRNQFNKQLSRRRSSTRNSCFLSCFGFSGTNNRKYLPDIGNTTPDHGQRKKGLWFSSRRKSSIKRTVPVDNSVPKLAPAADGKMDTIDENQIMKDVKICEDMVFTIAGKENSENSTTAGRKADRTPVVGSTESDRKVHRGKPPKFPSSTKNISASPANVLNKAVPYRTTSFPPPGYQMSRKYSSLINHTTDQQVTGQKHTYKNKDQNREVSRPVARQASGGTEDQVFSRPKLFGPLLGMTVLVVTLGIMIFWGRGCAVICTSIWIYVIRYLRTIFGSTPQNKTIEISNKFKSSNDSNYDSREYRKKVVLEGFLQRKH